MKGNKVLRTTIADMSIAVLVAVEWLLLLHRVITPNRPIRQEANEDRQKSLHEIESVESPLAHHPREEGRAKNTQAP